MNSIDERKKCIKKCQFELQFINELKKKVKKVHPSQLLSQIHTFKAQKWFILNNSPLEIQIKVDIDLFIQVKIAKYMQALTQLDKQTQARYPFLFDVTLQSSIKCFSKNQNPAKYGCCQLNCKRNPFMCNDMTCPCYHSDCSHRQQLSVLINTLKQNAESVELKIQKSNNLFDNMVSDLTKNYFGSTKSKIQESLIANLFPKQSLLIKKLSNSNKRNDIHPKQFHDLMSQQIQDQGSNTINMENLKTQISQRLNHLKTIVQNQLYNIQKYCQSFTLFYDTKVLPNDPSKLQDLKKLFQQKNISKTNLLYRASENQFSLDKFHDMCDNIKDNILLVKTKENNILGAYTPLTWNHPTTNDFQFIQDDSQSTFLFNLDLNIKLKQQNKNAGILNSQDYAPQFGTSNTYDFGICSNANQTPGSFIYFRGNFADDNGIFKSDTSENWKSFVGNSADRTFQIDQWEIWQLTFQQTQSKTSN